MFQKLRANVRRPSSPEGLDSYRVARDGVLEHAVKLSSQCLVKWAPVVPDGLCAKSLPWKRRIFFAESHSLYWSASQPEADTVSHQACLLLAYHG